MAQGRGYWYNPINNVAVEVSRHEIEIMQKSAQMKLDLRQNVKEEINKLSPQSDEMEIKTLAVRAGLVRIRDWQKFLSIQLYASGNRLKDYLFGIVNLIDGFKNKTDEYKSWDKETQECAATIARSWTLKIDNLATKSSESLSPKQLMDKYDDEKFLEEKMDKKTNRPVTDIPMDESLDKLMEKIEKKLFKEEKREEEIGLLFEDRTFAAERARQGLNEDQGSMSRVLKHMTDPGVFGIITAYRGDYTDQPDDKGRRNKQRQRDLINRMKKLGYGVVKLYGAWDEGGGVGREESLLWFPLESNFTDMKKAGEQLFELTKKWSEEFEQDGAIYRSVPDPEAPVMLWRHKETDWDTGKTTIINDSIKAGKGYKLSDDVSGNEGKMYLNRIKKDLGDAWSQLYKGPKGRNFVFESE